MLKWGAIAFSVKLFITPLIFIFITSNQISHSVVSDSFQPHESQHTRPPCPSPTPGVHSNFTLSIPSTGRYLHNKQELQTTSIQKGHPKHSILKKMKRQRNIQQVKEHDKCPPNQTKEEEIGSLPEKEFRIMIVKMVQNFENKMELQINSLETRIKKIQEMFNKDIKEIKKESVNNE